MKTSGGKTKGKECVRYGYPAYQRVWRHCANMWHKPSSKSALRIRNHGRSRWIGNGPTCIGRVGACPKQKGATVKTSEIIISNPDRPVDTYLRKSYHNVYHHESSVLLQRAVLGWPGNKAQFLALDNVFSTKQSIPSGKSNITCIFS